MNGKLTDIGQWDWSGWLFGVDCLLIVLCSYGDICLDLFASTEEPPEVHPDDIFRISVVESDSRPVCPAVKFTSF